MAEIIKKKGLCGMCRSQCAIVATIEDGKMVDLEADAESPQGRLCNRGALAPHIIYSKDRLLQPLIREGKRGECRFREASWEEALDTAAVRLLEVRDRYGAEALVSYFGQGVLEDSIGLAGDDFFAHLGSPNDMDCGSICNISSRRMAPFTTYGFPYFWLEADIENSDIIVAWGKNPLTDDGTAFNAKRMFAAQRRGAKIIVVDPRETGMAEYADLWVPVTPGSDGALVHALFKKMLERKAYDKALVDNFTLGFPEFVNYLQELKLSDLLGQCGIGEKTFAQFESLFFSSQKMSLLSYTGLEYQLSGVQNIRALLLLWALSGKLDLEGGMKITGEAFPVRNFSRSNQEPLPIGAERFPLFNAFSNKGQFACFPDAVLENRPYPARALLLCGGSPVISFPDSQRWKKAYEQLDCFIVLERFMTEDAKYADLIFPVTTWYENASILEHPHGMQLRYPLIEAVGNCRHDVYVLQALAERLGFGESLPKDDKALHLWALQGDRKLLEALEQHGGGPLGTEDVPPYRPRKYLSGALRADGKPGFPTPSGKLEIKSPLLEQFGYEGLPVYHDFRKLPGMHDYPFMMTSGARNRIRIGTFGQNIPEMAAYAPVPLVDISEADALELGIKDGELVNVCTPFGKKAFTAKLCGMARHSIHIPYGGGSSFMEEAWREGNVNDLCSLDYHDPLSGFVTIKSIPCRLEKIPC